MYYKFHRNTSKFQSAAAISVLIAPLMTCKPQTPKFTGSLPLGFSREISHSSFFKKLKLTLSPSIDTCKMFFLGMGLMPGLKPVNKLSAMALPRKTVFNIVFELYC